jgi:MFS family permease
VPQDEYSQASFQINGGMTMGAVLAMVLPPFIMHHFGWRWVFYLAALPGLVWTVVWALWATDSPAKHKGMGDAELAFLRATASNPHDDGGDGADQQDGGWRKKPSDGGGGGVVATPWRAILTSPPIWGQFVCDFCQSWFGYIGEYSCSFCPSSL